MISHDLGDQGEKPIHFASRTLSSAEKNYSQIEREALAIIFGLKKFHCYLYGRRFTLLVDNKPLSLILGPKRGIPVMAATRIQRWAIQLSAYQYDIQFRKSAENANADGLSRCPLPETKDDGSECDILRIWTEEAALLNLSQLAKLPVDAKKIARETSADPILSRVVLFTTQGWSQSEAGLSSELVPYYRRRDELTVEEGCLLWGGARCNSHQIPG